MKKSLRVISLVLAIVMIAGSMSVLGYCRSEFRTQDGSGLTFDDVNTPVYSTEQYATMALDELDRMLNKEKLSLDIYIGKLDLMSVDGTITSVNELVGPNGSVKNLLNLGILGDAALLDVSAIASTKRANGDVSVLWDLLDLIGGLFPIVYKYVSGNVSLGALDGFIADYKFNVRELALGMLYQVTGLGNVTNADGTVTKYNYMDSRVVPTKYTDAGGVMVLAQDVLNSLVLGEFKQLDDLFYNKTTNKSSCVCYDEIVFVDTQGNVVSGELDTVNYDYYGWVHPDRWVTAGLGDFIRVPAGSAAPAASYSKVVLTENTAVYDFVEPLLQYAANNLGVPVLNRIVKNWLREKRGYTFDEKYTELYTKDLKEYEKLTEEEKLENRLLYTEDGEPVINPNYDYLYTGAAPAELKGDKIFEIFDIESFNIPRLEVPAGHTFVEWLDRNAVIVLKNVINANTVVHYASNGTVKAADAKTADVALADGDYYRFTWISSENADISYYFDCYYGDNATYLMNNVCNVLKFILKVTGDDFFSGILQNKGQVKTPAEIETMTNQQVVAYVLRSVINANVDYIWIEDSADSIIDVCFEACVQLAYQDLPQFTYTISSTATNRQKVEKALAILLDIGAYNINQVLDANLDATATNASYNPNTSTGLIPYLGNTGSYGTSVAIIAAWAVSKWANTSYGNVLSGVDLHLDDNNGKTTGTTTITEDTFWRDLDTVLNAIIPIKNVAGASTSKPDNRPWISADIAGEDIVSKSFVFDYLILPLLDLDVTNIIKILDKNPNGAFQTGGSTIENALADTVHRIFDILFPDCFDNTVNTIDAFLNNAKLASMVKDLIITLSATLTTASSPASGFKKVKSYENVPDATTNGGTISGKGKIIVEFALPIVCMILGLSSTQEFGELQNYVPSVINSNDATTVFQIYNGSSGVNTSYRDPDDYSRKVDHLYTYEITTATTSSINSSSVISTIGGSGTSLAAGESTNVSVSGYAAGDMLEMTFKYKVKGEDGSYLNNGTELSSVTYVYVGATDKGDDEILVEYGTGVNDQKIQYTTDYYITGGVSSLEGYSFRIKDAKSDGSASADGTTTQVNVTNVTVTGPNAYTASGRAAKNWVGLTDNTKVTEQKLNGKGGTYIFTPFKVDDDASRIQYNYQKDENGNNVKVDGLDVKTGMKELEGNKYYVANGLYTVTTTFSLNGTSKTITTRVHVYNDYGLKGLTNNAIAANRSAETLNTAGQNMLGSYKQAIMNAAVLSLTPHTNGSTFDTDIGTSVSGLENKYEEYYRALYNAIEAIKPNELNSGAQAIWNHINSIYPYNYTRTSRVIDGTTVWFQNWKDYDATGYNFGNVRDYVGVSFREFKSAVNDANSLIDREFKYIGYSEEDFDKLSAEDQAKALKNYKEALENKSAISSVESAMAIHKVDLYKSRLIPFATASNAKLQSVYNSKGTITAQGTYTANSYENYARARDFAAATLANSSASRNQMARAIEELTGAWKRLENGADYTALEAAILDAKNNIIANEGGVGLAGGKNTGAVVLSQAEYASYWTVESFTNYLKAIAAGDKLIADRDAGNELGASGQETINAAALAITGCQLVVAQGGGGEDPDPGEGGDEATYELDETFVSMMSSGGIGVCEYSPLINEDDLWATYMVENEDSDYYGTELTGILYGVPEYFSDGDIQGLFTCENCEVVVTETEAGYGTGSYALIVDNNGEVLQAYAIIFRGDVNADGTVTFEDYGAIDMFLAYDPDYDWWSVQTYNLLGADTTGDGAADAMDMGLIDSYLAFVVDIDQTYGGEVAE